MANKGSFINTELLLDIYGLERRMSNFANNAVRKASGRALRKTLEPMEAIAKARVPVDTGNLKRHIRIRIKVGKRHRLPHGVLAVVWNRRQDFPPYYGRFVERGTVRMPAQPFMRPAFDLQEPRIIGIFAREYRATMRRSLARRRIRL